MYTYQYGGKNTVPHRVDIADDLLVLRTKNHKNLEDAVSSAEGRELLNQLLPIAQYADADVTIMQCKHKDSSPLTIRDNARKTLKQEQDIQFAGRVLREKNLGNPVVYTENLFVKFDDEMLPADCEALLKEYQLIIKEKLKYTSNGYFVSAPEGTGLTIFKIAHDLLNKHGVELCHPELIKLSNRKAIFPQQWHLGSSNINGQTINANINVQNAWQQSMGEGVTIAVIDDGVNIAHEEFSSPGKIVFPRDVTQGNDDPRPKTSNNNHGTACAGVACAAGDHGASGVAPKAKLMPIRLSSGLGSQNEANAFLWAADNGADVISCSWGPVDGPWWDPQHPTHQTTVGLPDNTRLAIDYAIANGRLGKGCVITWAAGNGNEDVENDGYASYEKVIAVAASNDRNNRSIYSDFGKSVWCTFPSSDIGFTALNHPEPLTPGIWTTDREGAQGYNPGTLNPFASAPGDEHGNYTDSFGGTSSACPGVAGIAALILALNPDLTWLQVKDIIASSAVKIDLSNGSYNSAGHSPFYGFGRPDANIAVQLAQNNPTGSLEKLTFVASTTGTLNQDGAELGFQVNLHGETTIILDGPDGIDFDLYIKQGVMPTTRDYDQRAYTSSADETIQFVPQLPGTHFIMVRSYQGTGEFTLRLEQQ